MSKDNFSVYCCRPAICWYIPANFQAVQLDTAIASNRAGLALNRASFASALNTYYAASRSIAREILHVIFFVCRGAPSDVIKEDIQARVYTIHAMFGLAKDQALIWQGHYGARRTLVARRVQCLLPVASSASFLRIANGLQPVRAVTMIVRPTQDSKSLQFLEALG